MHVLFGELSDGCRSEFGTLPLKFWHITNRAGEASFSFSIPESEKKMKSNRKVTSPSPRRLMRICIRGEKEGGCASSNLELLRLDCLSFLLRMVPDLQWVDLRLSDSRMVQEQWTFRRNHTLNYEFQFFPRLAISHRMCSRDAGQQP